MNVYTETAESRHWAMNGECVLSEAKDWDIYSGEWEMSQLAELECPRTRAVM